MWAVLINNEWFIASDLVVNDIRYTDTHLRGMAPGDREALGVYPARDGEYDGTVSRCVGFTYALVGAEVVGTPTLLEIGAEELKRISDTAARNAATAELATLDAFLPRGVEDLISALSVDPNKLPTIQQQRITRKGVLRQVIKDTAYLIAVV
jgi:hypothetical protein